MEEARKDNIEKLAKRYPNKFEDVITRDVNTELNHIKGQYDKPTKNTSVQKPFRNVRCNNN